MTDLKELQIKIHKVKDQVQRETEFSPKCDRCHNERFYILARNVVEGLDDVLKVFEKNLGPISQDKGK